MFGSQGGESAGTRDYMQDAQQRWVFMTNFDLSTIKNEVQLNSMVKDRSGISETQAKSDVQAGAKEPRNAGLLSYACAYITNLENRPPAGILERLTGGREAPGTGEIQPMSRPASVWDCSLNASYPRRTRRRGKSRAH